MTKTNRKLRRDDICWLDKPTITQEDNGTFTAEVKFKNISNRKLAEGVAARMHQIVCDDLESHDCPMISTN